MISFRPHPDTCVSKHRSCYINSMEPFKVMAPYMIYFRPILKADTTVIVQLQLTLLPFPILFLVISYCLIFYS